MDYSNNHNKNLHIHYIINNNNNNKYKQVIIIINTLLINNNNFKLQITIIKNKFQHQINHFSNNNNLHI